ncbi:diguanylate cyclase [Massilia sp. GCM10020059]|uniref:diguanylate cyclase n=1 Tax=Massilia agrisoli TaxID=2892444 RepID=A0ABS8IZG0_9BURK|nr:sensor domain-containing diguanylate cyclase [Massilia agrisoli]MCC6073063.1 sensor domain-containing diguanylate cyclase [Massilia agrisoli]
MSNALPTSLMSALIEESLDAVLIIDEHCRIRYANQSLQTLCGCTESELMGQPLEALLPGATAPYHTDYVREYAIRHKSGTAIPVEMKALDLGEHDGLRYFGAFLEDLRPRRRMEEQNEALLARLEQEAMTDVLTGIANRRAFEAEAAQMMARSRRTGKPVAVGIADIDHFKNINDEHGHPVGDIVLRTVASRIVDAARATDFVARIGGEEFGLLFPETPPETAIGIAQRIREAVAASPIPADGAEMPATISIGLATMTPGSELDDALASADSALYTAKNGGRNRVEAA